MEPESLIVRGAPRYLRGPAAGPHGVLAVVPEAQWDATHTTLRPLALIVLPPGGVHHYALEPGGRPVQTRPSGQAPAGHAPGADPNSYIVPGASAEPEDPLMGAVFGPSRETARGVQIALAVVTQRDSAPPTVRPAGSVTVTGGRAIVRDVTGRRVQPAGHLALLRALARRLRGR